MACYTYFYIYDGNPSDQDLVHLMLLCLCDYVISTFVIAGLSIPNIELSLNTRPAEKEQKVKVNNCTP